MHISIIAAVADDGTIGDGLEIPWDYPEDLKHFREMTLNRTVIMGRKTFASIGGPLPGRDNIVLSGSLEPGDAYDVAGSVNEALSIARNSERPYPVFIIGGASVYREFIELADELRITRIPGAYDGSVRFPPVIEDGDWDLVADTESITGLTFHTYVRDK